MIKVLYLALFCSGLVPMAVCAHHSVAEYDRNTVTELEGKILSVHWRNPHVGFSMEVLNEDGTVTVWNLEAQDRNSQDRRNVARDLLKVGETVKVAGNASTRRAGRMFMNNILLASGVEIVTMSNGKALWSEDVVGGPGAVPSEVLAQADDASGIFRVWMRQMPPGRFPRNLPLTESAAAARAEWVRAEDDFMLKCIPPGMPFAMQGIGPHPIDLSERDGDIVIRAEYFDIERKIYMNPARKTNTNTGESGGSPLGHSTGYWEGGALLVRTTHVNWPHFDRTGVPLSSSAVIEERFTPGEDESQLSYDIRVIDPEVFTEPVEAHWTWRWHPELEVEPYQCTLGAA